MATPPLPDPTGPPRQDRVPHGDRDAFERVFRTWYARLADYACSLVRNPDAAEDVVQEVFVALWARPDGLPEPAMLPAYLYRAVRNRSLNYLRQARTAGRWAQQADPDPAVAPEAPDRLEEQELAAVLRAALDQLTPRGREVFLLSRDRGLTYPQIADTLGISVKTVETLMGRALRALRERLKPRVGRETDTA